MTRGTYQAALATQAPAIRTPPTSCGQVRRRRIRCGCARYAGNGPEGCTGNGPEGCTGNGPEEYAGIGPEGCTGIGPEEYTGNGPEGCTGSGPEDRSKVESSEGPWSRT
jgi:hypothetical protein